jgi:tetratricopeptide (TPR) repeat protein
MASASDAQLKVFADLCDGLLAQAPSDAEKASLRGMIMDSCFRLEDYERTLRLLDQGVPGQDEQWHKMMINKVKAHLALKEGRKQEAVDRFRAFMEYIRTQAMDQTDPVTGNRITKEEILGLNAKRIGDILASMGQDEDARAMYKSARESYQAALERTSPGPEYDRIQAELGKIPAP